MSILLIELYFLSSWTNWLFYYQNDTLYHVILWNWPSSAIWHECSTIIKGEWVRREWLSLAPCPLAMLCWPEFSLGLPQIRWHPEVGGSVVRPSSTRTEVASTRDSWTLCAAPAPASVPGHCQTRARANTRMHTGTHIVQTREVRLETKGKEMSTTAKSLKV